MEVAANDAVSGQPTGNASDGLSDAISAALSASRDRVEDGAPETAAPEVKEPDASVDEKAGEKRGGEDAEAAKEPTAKAKDADAAPKDKGDASTTFEVPKHWSEADRKAFAGLPPENQALIRRLAKDLEGGFTRKSQELGDKARYADAVRGLIDDQTRR